MDPIGEDGEKSPTARKAERAGHHVGKVVEVVAHGVLKGNDHVRQHAEGVAAKLDGALPAKFTEAAKQTAQVGAESAKQAAQVGAEYAKQAAQVGVRHAGQAVQAGVGIIVENRQEIGDAVATGGKHAVQGTMFVTKHIARAGTKGVGLIVDNKDQIGGAMLQAGGHGLKAGRAAVGCVSFFCGAAANNACNILRPTCSSCDKGLTGGCACRGEWVAYKRPGCDHLMCGDCQSQAMQTSQCIKCSLKPKSRQRQPGCFDWLFRQQKSEGPVDFEGYVSIQEVMKICLPALAEDIAEKYPEMEAQQLMQVVHTGGMKALLETLARNQSIPIVLK